MATITSVASGNWGTAGTWDSGVPANGDAVVIAEGHEVIFNVDQSGFTNGLLSLTINGRLGFNNTLATCLKMNGNITGTGELIVAMPWECEASWYTPITGYTNVRTDNGFSIMALETLAGVAFTEVESIDEVEETPNSYFLQWEESELIIYWHQADATCRVFTPINRPNAGSEYKCYLLFNSTATINVPTIKMYGHYPEREYTQLSADANSGQNQIVLSEDLRLQQGDIIVIGSGTEYGSTAETAKGIYTVSAYDSETKIVTLTSNLETNRIEGDCIGIISGTIEIDRVSGTRAIITSVIDNLIFHGVKFSKKIISVYYSVGYPKGWIFRHCKFPTYGSGLHNSQFKDCVIYGPGNYGSAMLNGNGLIYENCAIIATEYDGIMATYNAQIKNSVIQNTYGVCSGGSNPVIFEDCEIKNFYVLEENGADATFINCEINGEDNLRPSQSKIKAFNSIFKDNTLGYFHNVRGELTNCLFEGETEISSYKEWYHNPFEALISKTHNQIPGNYKAWMKGGTIETDTDGLGNPIPGHLIFTCESADYPVFRDFPMLLAAYKTNRWQALVNKSFTGGEVKIELIDPTSDPLIDSEATPLASYSLPDQADTNLALKLGYKSDKAMQAILRISATNSEGTVEVNTSLIENRINHGS